jgi:DNA polymerase III delta prime subunit
MEDGIRQQLKSMLENPHEKLPHLLFYGKAGTGKSTVARIIANKLGATTLLLNSSDERGIQVVRDKIKTFAQAYDDKLRIVLLDEADGLTPDAQQSLRNLMETYSRTCRFILTANYRNKIIEPLISRTISIEFKPSDKEKIYNRLVEICKKENIKHEEDAVRDIVNREFPDLRKTINSLQFSIKDGKVTKDTLVKHISVFNEIWTLIKAKKLFEIRQLVENENVDYQDLYRDIYERIFKEKLDESKRSKILIEVAERMYRTSYVADEGINFTAFLCNIFDIL